MVREAGLLTHARGLTDLISSPAASQLFGHDGIATRVSTDTP